MNEINQASSLKVNASKSDFPGTGHKPPIRLETDSHIPARTKAFAEASAKYNRDSELVSSLHEPLLESPAMMTDLEPAAAESGLSEAENSDLLSTVVNGISDETFDLLDELAIELAERDANELPTLANRLEAMQILMQQGDDITMMELHDCTARLVLAQLGDDLGEQELEQAIQGFMLADPEELVDRINYQFGAAASIEKPSQENTRLERAAHLQAI